jgi:hypothetical protein
MIADYLTAFLQRHLLPQGYLVQVVGSFGYQFVALGLYSSFSYPKIIKMDVFGVRWVLVRAKFIAINVH